MDVLTEDDFDYFLDDFCDCDECTEYYEDDCE